MTDAGRLARRLERERRARREAETIAEQTTRDLYDRQQELALLEAVAGAANEASSLEAALEVAVPRLARHFGWPVGHAWTPAPGTDALRSTGIWHVETPELHDPFREVSAELTFGPGEGLPGRVLTCGEPVWVAEVGSDGGLPRRGLGLEGAFAFPVVADGDVVAVLEFFSRLPVRPEEERIARLAAQVAAHLTRVAERLLARERLAHQALHDALTGLPNRALFEDRLDLALARAGRQSTFTAVLFLDVDRFKLINDTLGHRVGDRLLREAAERVRSAVRASDTVARFGGDEFAVLCEGLGDDRDALTIANAVHDAMRVPLVLDDGGDLLLGASIGIALARGREARRDALLRDADAAMYRAKELGRGRIEVFDDRLRERLDARLRIERELRHGLEHGELRLAYQPVISLADGRIGSVEALVRWHHPERGVVSPGEFLPVAEESGLIIRLGEEVLGQACRQAAHWRAELGEDAPLPINVNLAARQLGQPGFVDVVLRIVAESGVDAHDIALEITESAVIENTLLAADTLDQLKALGFTVLLDDFGTGYSSLSYLQRLPIDVLKIDRSFISALGDGRESDAIVRAIVGIAEALRIGVVAEGIETAEQASTARALGCDSAQGFHFARPSGPEGIEALVEAARERAARSARAASCRD
jgi:diguanylate cyclase (GGDEF)-like protein